MKLVCIICPRGCEMNVDKIDNEWKVSGNSCRKGHDYAIEEMTSPKRIVTSSVKVNKGDYDMVSVRTNEAIPVKKINEALKALKNIVITAPINVGDIVVENIAQTNCHMIATRRVLVK